MLPLDVTHYAMTVEVYKPALKPRPVQSVPTRSVTTARRPRSRPVIDAPSQKEKLAYTPIKPQMNLVIGIEDMTHPDRPSFAELEALILAGLSERSPIKLRQASVVLTNMTELAVFAITSSGLLSPLNERPFF